MKLLHFVDLFDALATSGQKTVKICSIAGGRFSGMQIPSSNTTDSATLCWAESEFTNSKSSPHPDTANATPLRMLFLFKIQNQV